MIRVGDLDDGRQALDPEGFAERIRFVSPLISASDVNEGALLVRDMIADGLHRSETVGTPGEACRGGRSEKDHVARFCGGSIARDRCEDTLGRLRGRGEEHRHLS